MIQTRLGWLIGLCALWGIGCTKPCENTAQCGSNEMCAAASCEALSCEKTIFAVDPQSGTCTPLSGCFLTTEQLTWHSCNEDPCLGSDENSCLRDSRCQPAYTNPILDPPTAGTAGSTIAVDCAAVGVERTPPEPGPADGLISAPGVNNGTAPKHPDPSASGCGSDNRARAYAGCHATPQIAAQPTCDTLDRASCQGRRDCTSDPKLGGDPSSSAGSPTPTVGQIPARSPGSGQCFTLHQRPSGDCASSASSCLLDPACQPIGTRCFCPPGATCDCTGGAFVSCQPNDRLRRCHSSSDCDSSERCDNDEACIAPRTFSAPTAGSSAVPGTGSCLGACVPKGCAGMGEQLCNADPACNGGSYGTVCRPKPYCAGGGIILEDPKQPPSGGIVGPGGNACGCDSEFLGCTDQAPQGTIRPERSLLVRDPEIIDDPAFQLDQVLGKLAPSGRLDEFTASLLRQIGGQSQLPSGAKAQKRLDFGHLQDDLQLGTVGLAQRLAALLHITALVNRVDLAKPGSCGEARLTYALTRAYDDGNQRMTMIVELRVPDDGHGCRSVAQRWAELSLLDSTDDRRRRLLSLYGELLAPASLGQIRTNEFLNRSGRQPWELREFHLDGSGLPILAPVAQTVDKRLGSDPGLLDWVKRNSQALTAGNATIPTQYLAAASTEDGGRIGLTGSDPSLRDGEKALNAQACAGCHLTETQSPFVHIGERLGKRLPGASGYQPVGRAVIDSFLEKELVGRSKNLAQLLAATPQPLLASPRTNLARVH